VGTIVLTGNNGITDGKRRALEVTLRDLAQTTYPERYKKFFFDFSIQSPLYNITDATSRSAMKFCEWRNKLLLGKLTKLCEGADVRFCTGDWIYVNVYL